MEKGDNSIYWISTEHWILFQLLPSNVIFWKSNNKIHLLCFGTGFTGPTILLMTLLPRMLCFIAFRSVMPGSIWISLGSCKKMTKRAWRRSYLIVGTTDYLLMTFVFLYIFVGLKLFQYYSIYENESLFSVRSLVATSTYPFFEGNWQLLKPITIGVMP